MFDICFIGMYLSYMVTDVLKIGYCFFGMLK